MFNQTDPSHQMRLEKSYSSGAEEWFCPTCGRRMIMTWPPKYQKIILEHGDDDALHSSSKGGLQVNTPQVSSDHDPEISADLRAAIEEALEDLDFDDWATPPNE
jgi:hypothetical protein